MERKQGDRRENKETNNRRRKEIRGVYKERRGGEETRGDETKGEEKRKGRNRRGGKKGEN